MASGKRSSRCDAGGGQRRTLFFRFAVLAFAVFIGVTGAARALPPPHMTRPAASVGAPRPVPRPTPVAQVDELLFCNQPERLTAYGACADAMLRGGKTYRIFFHYRNDSGKTAPFVVAFQGSVGRLLHLSVRKGIAEPTNDPPRAGQQAMARYLNASETEYTGKGGARFPFLLDRWEVASGVVTIRADQDVRLRLYFGDNKRLVAGAQVVRVIAARSEVTISLTPGGKAQYYRIGEPETLLTGRDGAYGHVYAFRINAPAGSRVRVTFSPRGGQSGLVAQVGNKIVQSPILGAESLAVFTEGIVGKDGLMIVTLPFGGVFYPVEVAFHLI